MGRDNDCIEFRTNDEINRKKDLRDLRGYFLHSKKRDPKNNGKKEEESPKRRGNWFS